MRTIFLFCVFEARKIEFQELVPYITSCKVIITPSVQPGMFSQIFVFLFMSGYKWDLVPLRYKLDGRCFICKTRATCVSRGEVHPNNANNIGVKEIFLSVKLQIKCRQDNILQNLTANKNQSIHQVKQSYLSFKDCW